MSYQLGLLAALRKFGVPVIEIDGWKTRGSSTFDPRGSVNHHTAGARYGAVPSLNICINGRSDLPGPLCNVLGGRDHVARLVAAGRANHAGRGGTRGLSGNSSVFGLEMEHVGVEADEPITEETIHFMAKIHAAFAYVGGFDEETVVQHWEWTTRKIDFVKFGLDPDHFRGLVSQYLVWGGPTPPVPPLPPEPSEEDEIMAIKDDLLKAIESTKPIAGRISEDGAGMKAGEVWVFSPAGRFHVDRATLNALYFTGQIQRDANGQPHPVSPSSIAKVPVINGPVVA